MNLGTTELLILILVLILWMGCLADIFKSKMTGTNILLSLIMIFLFPILGCIVYLVIRNRLKEVAA